MASCYINSVCISDRCRKNVRTRCSAVIIKGSNSVLIDTSPDIRHQLLSNKIKNISSVVFTHEHADQTNGLFELRPFYWKNKNRINIYASKNTLKHLTTVHKYLFKSRGDYPAIVKSNAIKPSFSLGKDKEIVFFKSIKLKHGKIYSIGYIFERMAYISDCNDLSIINKKEFKNLKYLVLDCLKFDRHPSHFNLEEALYIHKVLRPKKTILTNLHHDMDYDHLLKILPNNIVPAYDGLTLNI